MAVVTFIGLGNMGLPMASSLLAVGHAVIGHDLRVGPMARLEGAGGRPVQDAAVAVAEADFIITCLPDFASVKSIWLESPDLIKNIRRNTILIDCSTIGVEEARSVAAGLEAASLPMLDAPILGDPRAARARQISFAVGGSIAAFTEAKGILEDMGERVVHVGKNGMGQAAVLCAELMTFINLLGAAEAFALGERLGLPAEKLFELASLSSAASWALVDRCPQSGLVPEAPSNNLYQGGLPAQMAASHLRMAEQAGEKTTARVPLTNLSRDLFAEYCDTRDPRLDFSAIIQILRNRS